MPVAVVAIGGNALSHANQRGTIDEQFSNAQVACTQLAHLIERGWDVILTHGNGPQIGQVLRRVELAAGEVYRLPLDICDADTQGGMGYMLQQVLHNELRRRGLWHTVVTLVTQVLVDAEDKAFAQPTKPIGRFFAEPEARQRMHDDGWTMVEDAGRGWRRVVPSPQPLRIVEIDAVRRCIGAGIVPITVGGGGIPVVEQQGGLHGIEAVIDKDRATSLLAIGVEADVLLLSTAVERVQVGFGTPHARAIEQAQRDEIKAYQARGEFPAGSMGPKIESALQFLDGGGKEAIITDINHIADAIFGKTGTHIN